MTSSCNVGDMVASREEEALNMPALPNQQTQPELQIQPPPPSQSHAQQTGYLQSMLNSFDAAAAVIHDDGITPKPGKSDSDVIQRERGMTFGSELMESIARDRVMTFGSEFDIGFPDAGNEFQPDPTFSQSNANGPESSQHQRTVQQSAGGLHSVTHQPRYIHNNNSDAKPVTQLSSNGITMPQRINSSKSMLPEGTISGTFVLDSILAKSKRVPNIISRTPPSALGTSYERQHFGKRMRAGSISGRLRSASDLEDMGVIDGQQKSIFKDLLIAGDQELQIAVDKYENGDKSELEQLIKSGKFQQSNAADIDILDDLDLDYLNVNDIKGSIISDAQPKKNERARSNTITEVQRMFCGSDPPVTPRYKEGSATGIDNEALQNRRHVPLRDSVAQVQKILSGSSATSGLTDDGIGELEFHEAYSSGIDDTFASTSEDEMVQHLNSGQDGRVATSISTKTKEGRSSDVRHIAHSLSGGVFSLTDGGHPLNGGGLSITGEGNSLRGERLFLGTGGQSLSGGNRSLSTCGIGGPLDPQHQQRIRSDTFSTVLDEISSPMENQHGTFGSPRLDIIPASVDMGVSNIPIADVDGINNAVVSPDIFKEEQYDDMGVSNSVNPIHSSQTSNKNKTSKPNKSERKYKKDEKNKSKDSHGVSEPRPIVHGLGLPRSNSDPNLTQSTDKDGLLHVDRPEGWVGAYSPESRKIRIERFMKKRNHRVWTKKVKYDVRKNFADSRLRVKGRFVRKEDELLMRDLLSLT